jgi:hypothetical protein
MEKENVFLSASRKQLRFATAKGYIATDDLWQLSLKDLDAIGQRVIAETPSGTVSLLENPDPKINKSKVENNLRLEVIKEVIRIKQDENKAEAAARSKTQQKVMLLDLIERKKVGSLESKSLEELEAALAAIG